jgi:predicted nuclease of predicted toxin-antitoxin system
VPGTIRFHLDESAPSAVATALARRGIDVTTPQNAGLTGGTDLEHLDFCRREGRVIFTQDAHFLAFHQAREPHAGMVYCHQQSRTIGQIVRSLAQLWENCEAEEMTNRVEFI